MLRADETDPDDLLHPAAGLAAAALESSVDWLVATADDDTVEVEWDEPASADGGGGGGAGPVRRRPLLPLPLLDHIPHAAEAAHLRGTVSWREGDSGQLVVLFSMAFTSSARIVRRKGATFRR